MDSDVVTSVPRATAALDCGWAVGNGARKCAAALGGMEVLECWRCPTHLMANRESGAIGASAAWAGAASGEWNFRSCY